MPSSTPTAKASHKCVNALPMRSCIGCGGGFQPTRAWQKWCKNCQGSKTRVVAWAKRQQPTLFDQKNNSNIQAAYEKWKELNPQIWMLIRRYAYDALASCDHFGVKAVVERVRWEVKVEWKGRFKINNSWPSRMARDLIAEDVRFGKLFELRRLRSP